MLQAWTPENRDTNIPKLDAQSSYTLGEGTTDFNLISSNYLALNNITLGYTLPGKWTAKLGIGSAASCDLALWSKRKGLDPRMALGTSSRYSAYSPIRTISGGIKVVF